MPTAIAEPIPPQHSPHGEQDSAVHEPQVDTTSEQAPEEESAATAEALTGNPAEPVMEASPGGTPVAAAPAAMAPMSGAPPELAPMEGNPVAEEEPAMAEEQESATQEFASGEGSAPPSDGDAAAGSPADSGASGSGDSGTAGDDPAAGTGEQAEPAEGEQEQSAEAEENAGGAPAGPVHTTPRTPEEDPNFQATVARKDETVAEQEAHEAPAVAAGAAQAAAVSPANERESLAEAGQVNEMDQEEPGVFDAASFKAMLMEAIRAILPKNNDEADDFASSGKVDRIKDQATSQVESEKESAAGNIEERTQEAPDTGSVPERQVEQFTPQDPGPAPVDIAAGSAMPPARGNAEVNAPLDQNVAEMDQTMADAEVTDDQLANSNEPAFTGALASKNDAETHAQEAPVQFRQQEQETLAQSESNAQATGEAQLAAMHQDRSGVMAQVTAGQQNTATQDTSARQKVADHINTLYEQTKTDVESILSGLDSSVETMFSAASDRATQVFEDLVEKRMRAYKRRRYSGLIGKGRWVKDLFAGLPDEANRFFTEGRDLYLHIMDTELTAISEHVAKELTAAKDRIQKGKQDIQDYVVSLPKDLQQVGKDAADEINDKFDELTESVNSKGEELVDTIADMYKESLDAVDARIEEMKAANRGLIDMALGALMGVIKTILMIKDMLFNLLAAALEAIGAIISDPIGFLSNLIEGVKQGVQNFLSNILNHVMTGVIEWLTGSLGDVGIQMPDNLFSLSGIFDLVTQMLGLTWDYFRDKAVKMLGEPMVSAMETGFELFQIIQKDGIMGLWEHIKEQFNDLQSMVMDAIRDMIITKVIEAGIKWILGLLNPAGAFIKAAMLIIDIVKFFVERAAQIFELVNAFIDGIKALASGNVSAVAAAIEKALAKAIPVLIGFLASLVGVTGLTAKVQKIIKKIRKRIDKAITKVIRKAKRAFGKLMGKKKPKKGDAKKIKEDNKKGKPDELTAEDKKNHKKIGEAIKKSLQDPDEKSNSFDQAHKKKEKDGEILEDKYQPKLKKGINLDIKFKPVASDEKDGDIDVEISIKPNNYVIQFNVDTFLHGDFKKLLYDALEIVASEEYGGGHQGQFADNKDELEHADMTPTGIGKKKSAESNAKTASDSKEDKIVNDKSKSIHDRISAAQRKHRRAAGAEYYPNNTYMLGSGDFFIETASNYYIVPTRKGKDEFQYTVGNDILENRLRAIKRIIDKNKSSANATQMIDINQDLTLIDSQLSLGFTAEADQIRGIRFVQSQPLKSNSGKTEINKLNKQKVTIALDYTLTSKYGYDGAPLPPSKAKKKYEEFPTSIKDDAESTIFLAALMAEPARWSVSHITNMLLLGRGSDLTNNSDTPVKEYSKNEKRKIASGDYVDSGVYEHLSMTQGASDPSGDTAKKGLKKGPAKGGYSKDTDVNHSENLIKNVTERDFAAVQRNKGLTTKLETYYNDNFSLPGKKVVKKFVKIIKNYLQIKK